MILIAGMAQPETYPDNGGAWHSKIRFEQITGHPAPIVHYSEVTPQFVERYGFRAMFITGFGYGWEKVPVRATYGINGVPHQVDIPVLGACGGHQLIGRLFSNDVRRLKAFRDLPIRRLGPKEADLYPAYHPGYFAETGVQPVQIVRRDPILKGMQKVFRVPESHYCEVRRLPPGFIHLARNDNCEPQCFRHSGRPLYGAQFHAEAWTEYCDDGRRFITNFLRIAGLVG